MKPTNAFEKYVDPIFIIENCLQRYVHQSRDYGNQVYMKLSSYEDEEKVRFGMCKKIISALENYLDLDGQKKHYQSSIKNLTTQDLDYTQFFRKKQKYDEQLMCIAKLEYCKNKYKNENYIRNDLQILGLLSKILINLQNKYNNNNQDLTHKMFYKTKFYKYIKEASLEEFINLDNYNNYSIFELIDKLYNITLNYDYEHENKTVEPAIAIEHDTPGDLGHYVQDYYHVHIDEGDNTFENYKEQKDKEIYDWLVDQMHVIDINKTF